MKSYNKGEWSEPYLLLKLIADQKLYIGKNGFEKVEGLFYNIIKILHYEKHKSTSFSFEGDIVIVNKEKTPLRIPLSKFMALCKSTLSKITSVKGNNGGFEMPELMRFLKSINIEEVKSKSSHKQDITIQIEDPNTFISPTLGFSIKSQLGRPSTLLNASNATNFVYKLSKTLTQSQIDNIHNKKLFSEKFDLFNEYNTDVIFERLESEIFHINLQTIDYNFPKIISDILINYYRNKDANKNTIEKLTSIIAKKNEFGYNLGLNPDIYQMIVKRFLVEYALGMRAGQIWKRHYEADGGYLVIREDGEVLCYHFYFVKSFENYLFSNTKLETPSATRYHMADIYEENGVQKIKLNLQIRFIK